MTETSKIPRGRMKKKYHRHPDDVIGIPDKVWIAESAEDDRFYICDTVGIAPGEDIFHIGDDYETFKEAVDALRAIIKTEYADCTLPE